jgi:hypothetical protein
MTMPPFLVVPAKAGTHADARGICARSHRIRRVPEHAVSLLASVAEEMGPRFRGDDMFGVRRLFYGNLIQSAGVTTGSS